jgi:hypothetical protein
VTYDDAVRFSQAVEALGRAYGRLVPQATADEYWRRLERYDIALVEQVFDRAPGVSSRRVPTAAVLQGIAEELAKTQQQAAGLGAAQSREQAPRTRIWRDAEGKAQVAHTCETCEDTGLRPVRHDGVALTYAELREWEGAGRPGYDRTTFRPAVTMAHCGCARLKTTTKGSAA